MSQDIARLILLQAGRFAFAAEALNPHQSHNPHMMIPSVVNGALTFELLFKCLYLIDTGQNPSKTHDYSKIFSSLRPDTQQEMKAAFDTLIHQRDMSDVTKIESTSGIKIPRDLYGNLQEGSKVFVDGRYVYEGKPWIFMFYLEIKRILLDCIYRLRPDFREIISPIG